MISLSHSYDDAFFDTIDDNTLASACVVVPILKEMVPIASVVDVGCGRGAWLSVFRDCGATKVLGLDGGYVNQDRLLFDCQDFRAIDLSQPFSIPGDFDLAVCLEVAEHLPRKMARRLVAALCQAAPVVLFSAAVPRQGGVRHINEQWPDYWSVHFNSMKYVKLDVLRHRVCFDSRVEPYYKQNMFLFVSRSILEHHPRLRSEFEESQLRDVEIMWGKCYRELTSVRGQCRHLLSSVIRSIRNRLGY